MKRSKQKITPTQGQNIFSFSIQFGRMPNLSKFRLQVQNQFEQRIVIPRIKKQPQTKMQNKGVIQSLNISRHLIEEEEPKCTNLQFNKKIKANLRFHGRSQSNQLYEYQEGNNDQILSNFSNSLKNISQEIIQIPFANKKITHKNNINNRISKNNSILQFAKRSNSTKRSCQKTRNGSNNVGKYQRKDSKSKQKQNKCKISVKSNSKTIYNMVPKQKKSQINIKLHLSDFNLRALKITQNGSIIYLAIHKKTGTIYAIKSIRKTKIKLRIEEFILQIKLGLYFFHPNFVKTYGFFQQGENFYIIRQYLQEGQITQSKKYSFVDGNISHSLNQILFAINSLSNIFNIKFWHINPNKLAKSYGIIKVTNICITLQENSQLFSQMIKKTIQYFFQSQDRRSTFEGIQTQGSSIIHQIRPKYRLNIPFTEFLDKILFINETTLPLLWQHEFLKQTRFKSIMQD